MRRQLGNAILVLTVLVAFTWARPHEFVEGAKSSPAPLDKSTAKDFQTATFALG